MATEPLSAADVRKIVADGLAEALQTLRANAGNGNGQAGGNNAEGGNNPGNQNNRDGDFSDTKWRPGDIGYFDPDLDPAQGEGDCVTVGTNVYWRNVFLFTDQVKDNAQGLRAIVVRQNLATCLRGTALEWYTTELSDLEKAGLKYAQNGVEEWTKALIQRFKDAPSVALRKLQAERYSLNDARNNRNVRSYVAAVMRHSKAAELDKPIQ